MPAGMAVRLATRQRLMKRLLRNGYVLAGGVSLAGLASLRPQLLPAGLFLLAFIPVSVVLFLRLLANGVALVVFTRDSDPPRLPEN